MRQSLPVLLLLACGPLPGVLPDGGDEEVDGGSGALALDGGLDAGAGDGGWDDAGLVGDAGSERDAGGDAGSVLMDAGPPPSDGGVLYAFGRDHSPLTPGLVANLQRVAARAVHDDATLMKVGDSHTVSPSFLACFAGMNVDLAGRSQLQPTIDVFKATRIGSTTPLDRTSLAATVGWSATSAIAGSPSPMERELTATNARFATVMFGTNDIGFMNLDAYGRNMFTLVDFLLARGVVPIISSIPPRDDSATADAQVPWYNGVTRALAQSRGVPYVDVHRQLLPLPGHGLAGDNLHLNVYAPTGGARGCLLTSAGLAYGNNVRNLLTLEALARARGAVTAGQSSDTAAPTLAGSGTAVEPLVIPSLPFVDVRDTARDGARGVATWSGCSTANEGGPEVVYRLEATRAQTVRATVVSLGASDIDVHLLRDTVTASSCVSRNDKTVTFAVTPGAWFLVLDTFVSSGVERAGEYALVVMEQ
ncbi:MAG: SGNH/GDSL hydrolase family protein [Myxococcaceae bacterium]|nr:SGNH/GDSL hydrolase family protein [Myxococcaceae bacterium]